MKLIFFILFFSVCLRAYAQNITISVKNANLESVFKEIRRQTGYNFIYNYDWLQHTRRVTINLKNASINQVLDSCFRGQNFIYEIVDKTVSLKQKEVSLRASVVPVEGSPIRGKVTDSAGAPLTGASALIKNTNKGTVTRQDGSFEIRNAPSSGMLVISFTGFTKREIKIGNGKFISIALLPSNSFLDQAQVIAYGTTTHRLNTGDVSSVKAAEIENQPVSNALLALEGLVPGVEITQGSGVPGGGVKVIVRGRNSVGEGINPLYIIDGVPYPSQTLPGYDALSVLQDIALGSPLNFINPADIESIEVLKDADATAIYGSRGANGVILITTKKGRKGVSRLSANLQSGLGKIDRELKVLNTRQYLDMRYEAFRNDGAQPDPNADFDLTLWDTTRYTDWQKTLIGGTARYNDEELSVSGGNENTQYLIGGSFNKQTTVFIGDFYDQKGSMHVNLSNRSSDKKFGISFSGMYLVENNHLPVMNYTTLAMQLAPDAPPLYKSDGTINWAPSPSGFSSWSLAVGNPAASLLQQSNIKTNNLISNLEVSYELLPGWKLKSSAGYNNMQTVQFADVPFAAIDPATWPYSQRNSYFTNNNIQTFIIEPQTTYSANLFKGKLSVLAGATIQTTNQLGQQLNALGFNSDQSMQNLAAATNIVGSPPANSVYKYAAGFSRVNYNFADKYLINITGRRDGSSVFAPANRFHDFWAVGGGWIFSEEQWMKRLAPSLSYGKVRASYGVTGSDQIPPYSYLDLYSTIPRIDVLYGGASGLVPNSIYTPDLRWEETIKSEAGLELGFFQDRITTEANFYLNRSTNQLLQYALPSISGFTTVNKNLNALVHNTGWEASIKSTNIKTSRFEWSTYFNISSNRNKLVRGSKGIDSYYQEIVGYPLTTTFIYHMLGVDPITGLYQFATADGKATFTPNPATDRISAIDLTTRFYGGIQNVLGYNGVKLSFLFQFKKQPMAPVYLYNNVPGSYTTGQASYGSNQPATILNRWQAPGDVKPFERFSRSNAVILSQNNADYSDQGYGDASFIRLKNVSLSWELPDQWRRKARIQVANIYLHAQNLLTFTRYKGIDPETQNSAQALPPLRVLTLGIQLTI
jgi:TonB-dependent starch-binding outer membrane protein SusC